MEILKEEKKSRWTTAILLIINLIIWTIICFIAILFNGVVHAATTQNSNGYQIKNNNDQWSQLYTNGANGTSGLGGKQINIDYGNLTGSLSGTIYVSLNNTNLNGCYSNDLRILIYTGNTQNQNASINVSGCEVTQGNLGKNVRMQLDWNAVAYSTQYYTIAIFPNTSLSPLTSYNISGYVTIETTTPASSVDIQSQTVSIINSIISNFQNSIANSNSQYNDLVAELYNNHMEQIEQLEAVYTALTPDTTDFDSYEDIEDDLNQYTNINLNSFNVDIDTDTNNWVWTTLTSLLNTSALVFGMVISILSIGLIKLILNR